MKTTTVCLFAFFILFTAFQVMAEEDPIYGRKLINLSEEYVESFKPDSERPIPGTKPDGEWEQYNALRGASWQSNPAWSPDGSLIAFASGFSLYIVPAEGGVPTKLWAGYTFYEYEGKQYYMHTGGILRSLCFSPDGTEVLFNARIIDEERGTVVTLRFNEDGALSGAGVQNSISVIRAVNINTGETRIVVDKAREPQFSRNGKYFSYRKSDLTVRELSTGTEWVLAGIPMWSRCFSGDGNYIIYSENDQFYRIPVTGGDKEQISFDESSTLITRRNYPDSSPGDDYVLFDGNAGARSKTFYDEDGNKIGSSSTSSMAKISVLSVATGLSFPLVPIEGGAQSTGAKFSPDGTKICYAMINRDVLGSKQEIYIKEFEFVSIMKQTKVGIEEPASFVITGNYPNPFNPSTTIEFSLPEAGFATLVIYNIMGQKVREILSEHMNPGAHTVAWDGRDDRGFSVSAGIYVTRLQMNDAAASGRMMLVK